MTLPAWYWHSGDITLVIACSSKQSAALAMGVDEREVYNCLNPATGRVANEQPGIVLTRNIEEGLNFYDYHNRRTRH